MRFFFLRHDTPPEDLELLRNLHFDTHVSCNSFGVLKTLVDEKQLLLLLAKYSFEVRDSTTIYYYRNKDAFCLLGIGTELMVMKLIVDALVRIQYKPKEPSTSNFDEVINYEFVPYK